ncbi:MAG: hypothetical protein AB1742_11380 [bacterium]
MIRTKSAVPAFLIALLAVSGQAFGEDQTGPVKITAMTRLESHSKISSSTGDFSPETFGYQMISLSRQLQKGVIGNIYYLARFSFDDNDLASNIGGVNLIRVFNPNWLAVTGFNYTSDPQRGTIVVNPRTDRDRFSTTVIYTVNPKEKRRPVYSLTSSFSTVTDLGEQQTLSEKLGMKFQAFSDRYSAAVGYNFTYSLKNSEQLTNQFSGDLAYKVNDTYTLSLGALFIDNVFDGNQGDDTVTRLTLTAQL